MSYLQTLENHTERASLCFTMMKNIPTKTKKLPKPMRACVNPLCAKPISLSIRTILPLVVTRSKSGWSAFRFVRTGLISLAGSDPLLPG